MFTTDATTQPKPAIELRGINLNTRLSEETFCYSAKLYVDGALWGEVTNHGQGGPDEWHPAKGKTWEDFNALSARIKASYPRTDSEYFPDGLETDLELICGTLVERFDQLRQVKRKMAKKVVFIQKGNTYTIGMSHKRALTAAEIAGITAKVMAEDPATIVLNTLDDDALYAAIKAAK